MQNLEFEKVSMPIKSLEVGGEAVGRLIEMGKLIKEAVDPETGEVKDMKTMVFADPETEEKFQIWENATLLNTFKTAGIQPGDVIKIVRLPKISRRGRDGKDRQLNQYDVYRAKAH